jgi:hypothetical protein
MLVISPVTLLLNPILGKALSMLVYYLITTGSAFWIANSIRRNVTGEASFVLVMDARIVPLIIIATVALIFGVIAFVHFDTDAGSLQKKCSGVWLIIPEWPGLLCW